MDNFLEKSQKFVQTEDNYVREFIAFQLRSFPYTPSETVNELLQRALKGEHDHKNFLINRY